MLSFHLTPDSGTPLYNQIYEQIRTRILQGELPASAKLPSTRSLAANLGVSRNTIDTAYYQLQSEGYIDSAPKAAFTSVISIRQTTGISRRNRLQKLPHYP